MSHGSDSLLLQDGSSHLSLGPDISGVLLLQSGTEVTPPIILITIDRNSPVRNPNIDG